MQKSISFNFPLDSKGDSGDVDPDCSSFVSFDEVVGAKGLASVIFVLSSSSSKERPPGGGTFANRLDLLL